MASLQEVVVLFFLMIIGYGMRKGKMITDQFNEEIKNYVLFIALPALIIVSMNLPFESSVLRDSGRLLFYTLLSFAFIIIISLIMTKLLKLKGMEQDIYQFAMVFSNCGFMGYPVVFSVFGEMGVFYASIYNLSFSFLIWTYGVYLLSRRNKNNYYKFSLGRIFRNPGILAAFIGFFLFYFSIELPFVLKRTLEMLSATTTPLAMIFIGASLSSVQAREILEDQKLWALSFVRLLLLPFAVYVLLGWAGAEGDLLSVLVLITAMPVAAKCGIMAAMFGNDGYLGSKAVFTSTLLSMISIPIIILVLM